MAYQIVEDMIGRKVSVPHAPNRIISLVPSQTEWLYDLGLNDEVIGITKFCVHPHEWFRNKTRIGGTKNLNLEKIIALQPDLIIANKEENTKDQIEFLAQHFPVWISDVRTINDALAMMEQIAQLCNKKEAANNWLTTIKTGWQQLENIFTGTVLYLIWKDPYMAVAGDTFIHDVLQHLGFQNVVPEATRYPEMTAESILKWQPQKVLLSSEPYPFKEEHIYQIQKLLPDSSICLVDGEMFSWYGSRMKEAITYFQQIKL